MKRLSVLLFSLFLFVTLGGLQAQIFDPVHWSQSYKKLDDQQYELTLKAKIDKGWTIYSQDIVGDGPIPTTFEFTPGGHYAKIGKTTESGDRHAGYDKIFEMEVVKYTTEAVFKQKVKVTDLSKPIEGWLEFMTCDHERCLPPQQVDFSFLIKADEPAPAESAASATMTVDLPEEEGNNAATEQDGIFDPVSWVATLNKTGDNKYTAIFSATIDKGWYVYSKDNSGDGPIPTMFTFMEAKGVGFAGDLREAGSHRMDIFDPIFEMQVVKHKEDISFEQDFQLTDANAKVTGYFEFMTCDDRRCLPPQVVDFTVDFAAGTIHLGPEDEDVAGLGAQTYPFTSVDLENPVNDCEFTTSVVTGGKSMWTIFLLGFVGGLLALLTPCVFPMIPLTVSFFTKGSKDKKKGLINALLYGFFIFLVYLLLSIPFHVMDSLNPDILNDISTNIWLNISFFVIFLFFAFSFFGYYEITMPAAFTNKVSSAEGVGGVFGIFFMALTLALVSFSCTGPILGSLLAGALSSDGGAMQLTAGMSGFGIALALPFALFAAFPGWLNTLPRSGGWLNTVKVVLGFLELALAFKFLSNADLVKHWGLLKIEPFLLIWIVVALAMAAYLFGFLRFPHDSPNEKPSKVRLGLGVLSLVTAIYLMTGFRFDEDKQSFTSLGLLSGLAPPVGYSWLYPKECPNNLDCFKDLDSGVAYARKMNKPIMIDFTGHACVNCRKMEEHVWPQKEVYEYIKNDYVLISLYVDEKIELPLEEQVTVSSKVTGQRTLRRTGDKWAHFQTEYFNNNSQPYYVLIGPDGQLLNSPVGYTPDVAEFASFLECGQDAWDKLQRNGLSAR
ncbi:MAG: thioredoxin family protein [Saprospiraceae bacterium]|nr:thioredoxin family protein [Saprospiraceae bacterium]